MAFIGNTVQTQGFTPAIDYFNGNGVTVTFTLSRPVASVAQVIVAIDNVIQNPSSSFTVAGNAITFSSAPLSGTNNIWVEYTSLITTYQGISQDPTVIGDIRATGGYLAEGDFGNSFVDGAILDYVTGNGRITVGDLDDITFYHGGTAGRSEMMKLSYAGNSYIVGKLGVGAAPAAWPATSSAVDFGGSGVSYIGFNSTGGLPYGYIYSNSYYNGTNNIYKTNSFATATGFGNTGKFQWFTAPSGTAGNTVAFTEVMTIDNTGNVGIGTSSPSTKLNIADNGSGVALQFNGYTGGQNIQAKIECERPNFNNFESQLRFYTHNGSSLAEKMRIDESGNVLIGTTSNYASARTSINNSGTVLGLYCSGGSGQPALVIGKESNDGSTSQVLMQFLYNSGSAGLGQINGNGGSQAAFGSYSDIRLKENITNVPSQLEKICALRPVEFDYKDGSGHQTGFIAQEIQEVYPEAVAVGQNEMLTVTGWNKTEAYLVKAIQEQQAIIEDLKARIETLEAK